MTDRTVEELPMARIDAVVLLLVAIAGIVLMIGGTLTYLVVDALRDMWRLWRWRRRLRRARLIPPSTIARRWDQLRERYGRRRLESQRT
jgi:hypothetical protein